MAYQCLNDEEGLAAAAEKYQVDDEVIQSIRSELSIASSSIDIEAFHKKLEKITLMNTSTQRKEYYKAISNIIFDWKEEYRRICRI